MSPARIRTRETAKGEKRYLVLFRMGGRGYPELTAGTFTTLKEARARRDMVAGEIAAGRDPRQTLRELGAKPAPARTFRQAGEAMIASRHDWAANTRRRHHANLDALTRTFGSLDPHTITISMIQEWIAAELGRGLRASTILLARRPTLRLVLDHASVDPNPARSPRLRWPKNDIEEGTPPSGEHVIAMLQEIAPKYMEMFVFLERTGCEISAATSLRWEDIDWASGRVRVKRQKTSRKLWAQAPEFLLDMWRAVPADNQRGYVFAWLTGAGFRRAMTQACDQAGIPHYSPHDLRHRRGTIWHHDGVVARELAARMGHSSAKETLDTYSHVVPPGEVAELLLADLVRTRCEQRGD